MTVQRLEKEKAAGFRIKRGTCMKCLSGTLWVTACGEDIILGPGDFVVWTRRVCRAAVLALVSPAVIAVGKKSSLFEEFPLFHDQESPAGALAG